MVRTDILLSRYLLPIMVALLYLFLYIPIFVLVLYSFNTASTPYVWEGFSLRWYRALLSSPEVLHALKNSLAVACCSTALSLLIGVSFVLCSARAGLERLSFFFYGNSALPEIFLAVGLLSFFSFWAVSLGLTTLIAGHTIIGLGYVVPIVHGRFVELDKKYTEASLDLGATYLQTILRVTLPLLFPSLAAAGLLVFILSLDDFIISFFVAGGDTQTLPLYIFSAVRSGTTPVINALSTFLILVSSILVLIFSRFQVARSQS